MPQASELVRMAAHTSGLDEGHAYLVPAWDSRYPRVCLRHPALYAEELAWPAVAEVAA